MPGAETNLKVKLGGKHVPHADVFEFTVDNDLDQPDMAAVILSNVRGIYSSSIKQGDELEILAFGTAIFKGEVIGFEPTFDAHQPSRCTIRALNRLHRLTHGRKSRTFEKLTDQDIVSQICRDHSLSPQADATVKIKYDHVYQHNQTDLQFIRQRAARIDYEILVEDRALFFRRRKTDKDSGIKLTLGDGTLQRFKARMSGANQVSKVVVRGWDPVKRKEIIGTAQADSSLSGQAGPAAAGNKAVETVETDRPVYSQQEAEAIARGLLKEKQMSYITGDAVVSAVKGLKAGIVVTLGVQDPRFDGKYYVRSCRHRFLFSPGAQGIAASEAGYRVLLGVMRDSQSEGQASQGGDKKDERAAAAEASPAASPSPQPQGEAAAAAGGDAQGGAAAKQGGGGDKAADAKQDKSADAKGGADKGDSKQDKAANAKQDKAADAKGGADKGEDKQDKGADAKQDKRADAKGGADKAESKQDKGAESKQDKAADAKLGGGDKGGGDAKLGGGEKGGGDAKRAALSDDKQGPGGRASPAQAKAQPGPDAKVGAPGGAQKLPSKG